MKKIVIFSDLYNGKFYRESAKKCGWEPYIFLTVKCEDESIYFVNQFEDVEKLASDVETLIGGKPDAVLCCVEQISLPVAKYAEYIGVPINSVDTYRKLRDKKLMKQIWQSNGVDTAKYYYCQKTKDIPWEKINYPVIVKPTMGAASIGVYLCRNEEELKDKSRKILMYNLTSLIGEEKKTGLLVEEYIEGEEYSVDTIWYDGQPIIDGIMSKGIIEGPYFPDKLYLLDSELDKDTMNLLKESSHKAVKAAGDITGATHTEMRIFNGKCYVIESALRPGAGGSFYTLFGQEYGVSFYDLYISAILGKTERLKTWKLQEADTEKKSYWYSLSYDGEGVIEKINGINDIKNLDYVDYVRLYRKVGEDLPKEKDSNGYFGWIIGRIDNDSFDNILKRMVDTERMVSIDYKK